MLGLVAASLVAFTVITPTVASAAVPGNGSAFDCYGGTIYNVQRGTTAADPSTIWALDSTALTNAGATTVPATAVTTIPGAGVTNALGITRGGAKAYAIDQTATAATTTVHVYDAGTSTWTSKPGTSTTGDNFVAGAVDPFSGIYYYATYAGGVATIYGFNTATDTAIPGIIAKAALPITGTANGDFAFDQGGNLYIVDSVGTAAGLAVVHGPLPTTGSATPPTLVSTTLQTYTIGAGVAYNGIAFDNSGHLYVEYTSGTTTNLLGLDPNTGAALGTGAKQQGIGTLLGVDLSACSLNPTLNVHKNIVTRATPTDQFGLSITGGGIALGNTDTTTGSTLGVQSAEAGPVIGVSGTNYTVAETAASGSLANYTTTYSCLDAAASGRVVASGTGQSFVLNFPAPATGSTGPFVTCTFTNTSIPTITFTSALSGNRANTGDQFNAGIYTGSATGTRVSSTATATSTGTGSTVTAGTGTTGAYTAVTGTQYFLTEQSAGTTNLAQYTKLITCTDSNGQQTGLPTNQPYTGTLAITPVAGALISCVLTNAATPPTITLTKALGSPRALTPDQFTVAIRTGSVTGTVVNSTTNSTTTGAGSTVTAGTGTTGSFTATNGTTYYLTETSPTNYNSALTCVDANGIQTGLPTALALGTGYALAPAAGAAITCTITNSGTPVNLSLAKTNPTQLTVGTAANYTLTVTNNGGTTATTARVVDKLPANVQYNSATGTGWTCTATGSVAAGQLVTCNFTGSITSTGTSSFTINVTPQTGAAGTNLQNKAAVDPTGGTNPVDPTTCTSTGTPTGCAVAATQTINKVTAVPDTGTTPPATPITTNVLSNDTVSAGYALVPASVTVTTGAGHGGTTVNSTTGAITYTPAAGFSGVDTYGYQVCDNSTPTPVCAITTVTITVPQTVTAVNDTVSTPQNTAVTTAIVGNDTHTANGAALNPASVAIITGPAHGTLTQNTTTGDVTYTPNNGYTGSDSYTYTVCDQSTPTPICSNTATVNITVGGNVVTAVNDTANTTPGVAVATDVRANDSSSTGQPLAIPTINTVPAHGTTSIDPTSGVITYTPATGFSGVDTYKYQVCDTSNPTPVCSIATVTVNVPNTVVAVNDSATTPQNTAVGIPVIANDTVTLNGAPLSPASVTITTPAAHGTTSVNTTTGTVTYTPNNGYTGPDSFVYRVCDKSTPTPVCATATANITVGANTVTASNDTDSTVPGTPVTTDVRANDTSSTGQPLAKPTVTVAAGHGTTAVDPTTGNITYTPANGFSGVDTYTYQVCDTSNPTPVCSTATVTITVPNVVKANDDTVSTPQNQPVITTVLSNDTVSPNGSALDPLSMTATQPSHGSVAIDATGKITYVPTTGYSGPDAYTYTVCDKSTPTRVCSTATVNVTVGPNVVTANPDATTTPPGTPVSTDVRGNDSTSTGQPLANPTVTTPAGHGTTSVDPTTGNITYTPANGFSGVDTYAYRVCDTSTPTPVCSTTTVTITVPNVVTVKDDIVSTPQNTPNATPVLDNDTISSNGAPLNPASVVVATPAAYGTTSVNTTTGVITYTPGNGYTGPDSYTYTVCDKSTPTPVCGTATVNITVGANVVTATPDSDTTPPVTAVTTNVRTNDTSSTGQPLANPTVTVAPGHGTATVNGAGSIVYTPAAGFSGTDVYTYRVCDTSNPTPVCSSATVTITVPQTVTAVNDSGTTAPVTPITTDVLANDTHTTGGAPLNPASVVIASAPANGTTSINPATGKITYTPAAGFSGVDTYNYTVCDKSTPTPVCSTATVSITVLNGVTADPDAGTTPPITPISTDVLANDTTTGVALNPASVAVTVAPGHGTTSVNTTTGVVTYTPAAGFSGVDTYTYRVCDLSATPVCATALVTITVPNAPVANPDTVITPPNTPVTTNVIGNDTVTPGGAPLDPTSVGIATGPAHGTVTVDPTTGAVTYTPNPDYSGPDSFTYTVCDKSTPTKVCVTGTVSVSVPANVVTAVDDSGTTPPITPITTTVLGNDTVTPGGAALDPNSVAVTIAAGHGTTSVDHTTGKITYTPAAGFSGIDTYVYKVCDLSIPTAQCAGATVTITVPSTVTANSDSATTPQNTPKVIDVLANDTVTPGGAPLNPASVTTSTPAHGTVTVDPATGKVTYTPKPDYAGPDSFTYTVCDTSVTFPVAPLAPTPTPVCSTATVTITVPPNAVGANADLDTTPPGTPVTTDVLGNDTVTAGGAPLDPASVTVVTAPAHGTTSVNPATGAITYTPAIGFSGTDTYTYQVCDMSTPTKICGRASVTITVPNTVTAVDDEVATPQGTPVTTNVLANDTITPDGAPLDPASVTVTANPTHGTVAVNPDGTIKYTPAPTYSGPDSYSYQVCDTSTPTRICDTATVTISVGTNKVAANQDSLTTPPGTPITTDVRNNDSTATSGLPFGNPTITTPPGHGTATVDPTTGQVTYTPTDGFSGTDTFVYNVCDSSTPTKVCDSATVTVTVPNIVSAKDDSDTVAQNGSVTTDVLANDTITPNGSPLNPTSVTVADPPDHGTVTVNPTTGQITYEPSPEYSGPDSYDYQVCDSSTPTRVCSTATVTITVPANKVTAIDDAATTAPITPVGITVIGNDTVSAGGAPLDPASVAVTTPAGHGTTSVDPTTGVVTYTPAPGFSGVDTFGYTVCDRSTPTKVCSTATVTVTVPNVVTAVHDDDTTGQNTPVVTTVIGNDTITAGGAPLNPASVQVTTPAAHGTTVAQPDGTITYTPATDYSGPDTYSYQVCDTSKPEAVCSTATVSITVTPNQVTAVNDADTTTPITPVTIPVLSNDTVSNNLVPLSPASVKVTDDPTHGTTAVNLTTGAITYTPAAGFSGVDTFAYQVCDTSSPTVVCGSALVTVTVPNDVVAHDDASVTPQNTPVTTDVLANDTISLGGAPFNVESLTVPEGSGPTHGHVAVVEGQIVYVPDTGYTGPDSYTYRVCDASSPDPVCVVANVSITVGPNVVVANPDAVVTPPATAISIPVLGNDTTSTGQPLDPASVKITQVAGHGTTTVDPATGAVVYTPNAGFSGVDTFKYQVCDTSTPTPVCATTSVTVTVPNTVTAVDDAVVTPENTAIKISVLANDTITQGGAPLDPASVEVIVPPSHGTVEVNPDGTVLYTPSKGYTGQDTFDYSVCDTAVPTPNCADATVTITIQKTGLSIVKKAFVKDTNQDGIVGVGDTIDYTFTVTNIGEALVTGVGVVDPMIGAVTCPATELAAGKSMVCASDAGHVITAADVKSGQVTNSSVAVGAPNCPAAPSALRRTALAAAMAAGCPTVVQVKSNTGTVVTPIISESELSISKKGTWNDSNNDKAAEAGETVSWVITVSNPGRSTIVGLKIDDPTAGKATCPSATLAPGTDMICTVPDHVISSADVAAGHVGNVAFATGRGPAGPVVSPTVTATVDLPAPPAVVTLPNTGVPANQMLIAGLLTLLTGAAFLVLGRRRRSTR